MEHTQETRGQQAASPFYRITDLLRIFEVSRPTLDLLRKEPGFPKPLALSGHPRWRRTEFDAWLASGKRSKVA